MRIVDEGKNHVYKWFLTLTYAPDNLPKFGSLRKRDVQLFQKRLRKARPDDRIRFFTVGEYGEEGDRPHYHQVVWGTDFPDKKKHSMSGDDTLWKSEELNQLWGHGFCTFGRVTYESAAYVAGYVIKKINGQLADAHYARVDPDTGEVVQIEREFAIMSRRPGIGADWYDEFKRDVFPSDRKVVKGKERKVPRYYAEKFRKEHPEEFEAIQARRKARALKHRADSTPDRLAVREEVLRARFSLKKRKLG